VLVAQANGALRNAREGGAGSAVGERATNVRIDSHAHVFTRDLPLVPERRHSPTADATLETYLGLLDAHGIDGGVLVQPSFLGTDNSFLLACLRRCPERLRGVAVVPPEADRAGLELLDREGFVGIRLNLWGLKQLPDFSQAQWQRLFATVKALDWHVELHASGPAIRDLLHALVPLGVNVVIDHFGRPDAARGTDCSGFRALVDAGPSGRVWVKLSAPYRLEGGDAGRYVKALLDAYGPGRLVWGSDWPWTQHAQGMEYGATVAWLAEWISEPEARQTILEDTPARLFRFDRPVGARSDAGTTRGPGTS
jgi:predicted TIM-barrel fold metal-dependent hydrolase